MVVNKQKVYKALLYLTNMTSLNQWIRFNDLPEDQIAKRFLPITKGLSTYEVDYLTSHVGNVPHFSKGFTTCVATIIFGEDMVGVSHYDSREENSPLLSSPWGDLKEIEKRYTGKSLETAKDLYETLKLFEAKRVPPTEYVPRMLNSMGREQDLYSFVIGGNEAHLDQVVSCLIKEKVPVLGTYIRGEGRFLALQPCQVARQRIVLPQEPTDGGMVLAIPGYGELIVYDPQQGLVSLKR